MKILILGRTEYLFDTAELLAKHHDICGIITASASPEYSKTENDFKELAGKLGCSYYFINNIDNKVIEMIKSLKPDICISLNWKSILKEEVINLFPHGILNAHFGDLPSYRGNAVINWAILNMEKQIALTIHQMVPGEIDSGNVWKKLYMPIEPNTTIGDIVDFCRKNTPLVFNDVVNSIEKGDAVSTPQSKLPQKPFRCYPRLPEYSKIDWTRSADEIHALVRASTKPYSGAYSFIKIDGKIKKIFIWETSVESGNTEDYGEPGHIINNNAKTGFSKVLTGKGILIIEKAQYENDMPFSPGNVWKTIRMHFGIDVEEEIMNLYKMINKK